MTFEQVKSFILYSGILDSLKIWLDTDIMKIQLERTLSTCPTELQCVVCAQRFEVERIRSILYDRAGLIQGDLCNVCLGAKDLQQKLQTTEVISRPTFYQWWFKRLTVLAEATEEIERARFGSRPCQCRQSKPLRIRFQADRNSQ